MGEINNAMKRLRTLKTRPIRPDIDNPYIGQGFGGMGALAAVRALMPIYEPNWLDEILRQFGEGGLAIRQSWKRVALDLMIFLDIRGQGRRFSDGFGGRRVATLDKGEVNARGDIDFGHL